MSKVNTSKRSVRGAPPEARLQVYTGHSAQSSRLQFVLPSKKEFSLKVDAVWRWQKQLLVSGWTSSPCTLRLQLGEVIYTPEAFSVLRDDVDDTTPFALLLPLQLEMDTTQIQLCILVSNIGGMAEKVRDGVDGRHVAVGDRAAWGKVVLVYRGEDTVGARSACGGGCKSL